MTSSELIEALQNLPGDTQVVMETAPGFYQRMVLVKSRKVREGDDMPDPVGVGDTVLILRV